ncbi:MAG: hypothetical protein FWJ85_00685 [Solitalea sp.]
MDKRDQDFDEHVRKKLSEGIPAFDEGAWEAMERRLPPVRRQRWMGAVWLPRAAASLLLAGLGFWAYTTYYRSVPGPVEVERALQPDPGLQQPSPESPSPKSPSSEPSSPVLPLPRAGQPLAAQEPWRQWESARLNAQPAWGSALPEIIPTPELGRAVNSIPAVTPALSILRPLPDHRPERVAEPAGSLAGRGGQEAEMQKPVFSLGVLAAPDLNGSGGFTRGKLGFNVGITAGIHFNDRLSLHSGVIYARKPYNALPADYRTAYKPPTLMNIAAVCDVIDIPLNLRYTMHRSESGSISLSAGLSSYLMLHEQYAYQYPDREAAIREYSNENRHFMGVGNLGLALERKINAKTSISLEPFVKVPLTGIGHGSVRLISAGAGIRFNLDLSKAKNTFDQ